ncbi:MAG TPA: hypothetical protein ENH85_02825 [Candidatus Scalindua sp.]|nr:hypothetical protein [Candidatus Scalindua sp.]
MTAKLEGFQKTMNESFQKYFDEQEKYLQELRDQPTAIEQLQKFREDQKLPVLEKELLGIDQTILDVEGLLSNIEEDIRTRTEGLPVSEAAARRLTAIEQAPLSKRLTDLIRGRQRVAVGLEAKQRVVREFMTAQETDIQRQRAITEAKLGLGKERLEFEAGKQETTLEIYRTELGRLEKEETEATAEVKEATKAANTVKKNILTNINSAVDQYKLNPSGFRERYIESLVATYGEQQREYIGKQVYSLMPDIIEKPEDITSKTLISQAKINQLAAAGVPQAVALDIQRSLNAGTTWPTIVAHLDQQLGEGKGKEMMELYENIMIF